MSLTRKASSAAKKAIKPPRQDLAAALAERETELAEARRQQAATAEILRVISRSPADAGPVFEAILEACQRLFGSDEIGVYTIGDDDMVRVAAWRGPRAEEVRRDVTPVAESVTGRIIRERRTHHIPDLRAEPDLSALVRERVERLGSASLLYAPMLWEDRGLGSILVARSPPRPFSDREQALLQSFADQAAIAIENARLFEAVRARTRDLEASLEQQTATADVLKAISRSAFDLETVLESLISTAMRLCNAKQGVIFRRHGDIYRYAASHMLLDPAYRAHEQTAEIKAGRGTLIGRVALENRTVQIEDAWGDPDYAEKDEIRRTKVRSMLGVPLMRNGEPIGAFGLGREEPVPFTQRQIELVTTFADQAVIAIENVRLFDEVQAKTRDLEEALQQQTATANVLKVISRSAFDLDAVLKTLTDSARSLSGAATANVLLRDGEVLRLRAESGSPPNWREYVLAHPPRMGMGTGTGRVLMTGETVHIPDVLADSDYSYGEGPSIGNYRAQLGVPLLRNGKVEGVFGLLRPEPGAFTPRQIELVRSFADQAVIAIENARLFNEVQAKTRDLEESLQQQTATADVLKAISRTAFDLDTVLQTLISTAVRLCDASGGEIFRRHGDVFRYAASLMDIDPAYLEHEQKAEIRAGRGTLIGRVAIEKRTVEIADAWNDPEYAEKDQVRVGRVRAMLGVPLMRNGELIGAFALGRPAPVPFTKRQVELVTTFADQAVIAIENARLFDEVQARTRDLEEALAQQTATAEVLKVISRSAFDLQAVFDTLISSAVDLVGGVNGTIFVRDGESFPARAHSGVAPEFARALAAAPPTPGRQSVTARVLLSGQTECIADVLTDKEYSLPSNALNRTRSLLATPLLREDRIEGVLVVGRSEPGEFTQRQIDLVQTFADQAVIAIENVRLFDEVQARTKDLQEALQQQTATSDVLKVISRSAFDLDAVLNSLTKSAVELCNSTYGVISLYRDGVLKFMAQTGCTPEFAELLWSNPAPLDRKSTTGRAGLLRTVVLIPDVKLDEEYDYHGGEIIGNYRSMMGVPLLRNGELEGVFTLMRRDPGTFTRRQIELIQTFADQAVIAIENARLFEEVQARTRDLEESLQQQTATAEVLKVISRSAFDLQAVFDTLTASAVELCGAFSGSICVRDGDVYRYRGNAGPGLSAAMAQYLAEHPAKPGRGSIVGRVLLLGGVEEIPDVLEDADYVVPLGAHGQVSRALLGVPLLGKDGIEGALVLTRKEPGRFTPRQIEIVQTFADQAVIALENVRLFEEVQARTRDLTEALQMQTATSDVLKVISRSAFDLQTVFNTLVSSAVELGGALTGTICVRDGDVFRYRDTIGAEHTSALAQYLRDHPATPGRSTIAGRVLLSGKVERIPDCLADPDYVVPMGSLATNVRSLLGVPLLRKEGVEGAIILTRTEPGEFTDRQIEIVQTFADQAVIALENVRLFDEVQARTQELAASLNDLRKAQDRLIQSEKLASLGQLTAGIAHEIKNPLNFVNNFSALSRELVGELADVIKAAPLDDARRKEAEELIGTIDGNLDKVVSHGKRADSIVKNMLLHSREGSGERSTTNINAMVEEALNLAYHGARAEKPGFNVTIAKSLDPNAGAADLYPQEMTRVLLNLISNGFYATNKRKLAEPNGAYEPTLTASTRDLGHSVEIAIRDNGTGIADEVKAKMFNPFFTTKPAGEGTGLGLSLSHDIVVKQHGGTMEVQSAVGAFTQFTIILPRAGEGL